jgi:hypothetical protein
MTLRMRCFLVVPTQEDNREANPRWVACSDQGLGYCREQSRMEASRHCRAHSCKYSDDVSRNVVIRYFVGVECRLQGSTEAAGLQWAFGGLDLLKDQVVISRKAQMGALLRSSSAGC